MRAWQWAALAAGALLLLGAGTAVASERAEEKPGPTPPPDAPTYPDALSFVQARYFTPEPGRTVNRVVIHITSGQPDYRNTVEYFRTMNDGRKASTHYVCGREGELVECCHPDSQRAWHAGAAGNGHSVGVEHCARQPNWPKRGDPGLPVTPAQYISTARLCRWLCNRFGFAFDRDHVIGHNEADPDTSHDECPSGAWSWSEFARYAQPLGYRG